MVASRILLPLLLSALAVSGSLAVEYEWELLGESLRVVRENDQEIVVVEKDATIIHKDIVIKAGRGKYYRAEDRAELGGGVHATNGEITLVSDTATYYRAESRAVARGGVVLSDSASSVRADELQYFLDEERAEAAGNVVFEDTTRNVRVESQRMVFYRERDLVEVSGSPRLTRLTEEDSVEVVVTSTTMEISPEAERAVAIGNVVITRSDVTAYAGVANLFGEDKVVLSGDPVVVKGRDRLQGEEIELFIDDGEVSRVTVIGEAGLSHEGGTDDSDAGFIQVWGDTVSIDLENNEVTGLTVDRNASSSYETEGGEVNLLSGRTLRMLFDKDEVDSLVTEGESKGLYKFRRITTEGSEPDSVEYRAEKVSYDVDRKVIILEGNASLSHSNTRLDAEKIEYDPEAEVLVAEGEPTVWENRDRIVGTRMGYDLEAEEGLIYSGVTSYEEGLYTGKTIKKVGEKTLNVSDATYTTCANKNPHYTIESREMKLYLDDKVVAKPIILKIREYPVFALPFYVFPIRRGRHSGLLIPKLEIGLSEDKGRFVRNLGYYWAPNDYTDFSAWGDYYENNKWVLYFQSRYKIRYLLDGSITSSLSQSIQNNERRWDLRGSHTQELWGGVRLSAQADFVSDETYREDIDNRIYDRTLRSQASITKSWTNHNLYVAADRTEDLDTERTTLVAPRLSLSRVRRPLFPQRGGLWQKLYFRYDLDLTNEEVTVADEKEREAGAELSWSLTGSGKIGWLSLSPSFSHRYAWFNEDRNEKPNSTRSVYETRVSASTNIYGVFNPNWGRLVAVKHTVSPSISHSWVPEFEQYFDGSSSIFPSITGVGSTPRARNTLNMRVGNNFAVKVKDGDEIKKLDNLAELDLSTSYDFRKDEENWSDLVGSALIRISSDFDARLSMNRDMYDFTLQRVSASFGGRLNGGTATSGETVYTDQAVDTDIAGLSEVEKLRREVEGLAMAPDILDQPWSISTNLRYTRGRDPSSASYWADAAVNFSLTKGWRINYSVNVDLKETEITSQQYMLYRDLHCWEAQLVRRFARGTWEYYFRINIKALPEIQAERGEKWLQRSPR
jgi:lipopolysaccharide assembly outer membrane protein LptD (OstA)